MFSKSSKTLLRNHIRHTDTHNRLLEEDVMWQQRRSHSRDRRHDKKGLSHLPKAHMDSEEDTRQRTYVGREEQGEGDRRDSGKSTFWQRQLQSAEEQDPNRWGHGGYKELYPKEFEASDQESPKSDKEPAKLCHHKCRKKGYHDEGCIRKVQTTSRNNDSTTRESRRKSNRDEESSQSKVKRKVRTVTSRLQKPVSSDSESDSLSDSFDHSTFIRRRSKHESKSKSKDPERVKWREKKRSRSRSPVNHKQRSPEYPKVKSRGRVRDSVKSRSPNHKVRIRSKSPDHQIVMARHTEKRRKSPEVSDTQAAKNGKHKRRIRKRQFSSSSSSSSSSTSSSSSSGSSSSSDSDSEPQRRHKRQK